MEVQPYVQGKPIYYEFTKCPIADFAKRFNLTDIMPAMCNPDYAAMEMIHARLIRTQTCACGEKCDYTICGSQSESASAHPEYYDSAGYRRNK